MTGLFSFHGTNPNLFGGTPLSFDDCGFDDESPVTKDFEWKSSENIGDFFTLYSDEDVDTPKQYDSLEEWREDNGIYDEAEEDDIFFDSPRSQVDVYYATMTAEEIRRREVVDSLWEAEGVIEELLAADDVDLPHTDGKVRLYNHDAKPDFRRQCNHTEARGWKRFASRGRKSRESVRDLPHAEKAGYTSTRFLNENAAFN